MSVVVVVGVVFCPGMVFSVVWALEEEKEEENNKKKEEKHT